LTRLRLEFTGGPRRGDASVFSASRVTVGRSRSNTFVLPETLAPAASGRHAEFSHEDGAWWLSDLDSTNGTFVNGQRITRTRLTSGDRIAIGDVEFAVQLVDVRRWWAMPATWAAVAAALVVIAAVAYVVNGRMRAGNPQHVADLASRSVYLVAVEHAGGRRLVGTAFAIDATGTLATNAHVAAALDMGGADPSDGDRAMAILSDAFDAREIAAVRLHPDWRPGSVSHDVAVLELRQPVSTVPLTLGATSDVQQLTRGVPLTTFGFPALSTDPLRPRGRLLTDVLSDVRLPYLEVGLGIAPGTSGSPIFDANGVVVALVVSGDFVQGPPGLPPHPSGTNVNWAISVEELRPLLR